MPQDASWLPPDSSKLAFLTYFSLTWCLLHLVKSKLIQCWLQDASSLAQVGLRKKRVWVRKILVDAKMAQNLLLKGPGASPRRFWEGPGDLRGPPGDPGGQEAFQEASGVQKWPPRASKMTQHRPQNHPKGNPKWPPKEPISISILIWLFQICNTPTHLTVINEHTNSPNFQQRTHQLT